MCSDQTLKITGDDCPLGPGCSGDYDLIRERVGQGQDVSALIEALTKTTRHTTSPAASQDHIQATATPITR